MPPPETSGPASEFTLYRELERRLNTLSTGITAQLEQLMPAAEQSELPVLDANTLKPVAGGAASYAARCDAYAEAMRALPAAGSEATSLFGRLGEVLAQQTAAVASARERTTKYDGP